MERQAVTTSQSQRHRQRRKRLGNRNYGESKVSPGAVSTRSYGERGGTESR